MFVKEARWLARALAAVPAEELSPLLDIGSSTIEFRRDERPWIESELFAPLQQRGIEVVHLDHRVGNGIDIAADLLDDADFARVRAQRFRAVLCCNVLEHVKDPAEFARRCVALAEGGLVFATVPHSYPRHGDPIDNLYRPDVAGLAEIFPGTELVRGEIIDVAESYRNIARRRPWVLLRPILRFPFPFLGLEKWKHSMRKPYWLFTNYKVAAVVLRHRTGTIRIDDQVPAQAASNSGS